MNLLELRIRSKTISYLRFHRQAANHAGLVDKFVEAQEDVSGPQWWVDYEEIDGLLADFDKFVQEAGNEQTVAS